MTWLMALAGPPHGPHAADHSRLDLDEALALIAPSPPNEHLLQERSPTNIVTQCRSSGPDGSVTTWQHRKLFRCDRLNAIGAELRHLCHSLNTIDPIACWKGLYANTGGHDRAVGRVRRVRAGTAGC